jgi:curved DNA-binding protein CbpA
MNVSDCYRLLGLRTGASFEEVKAAYRRLARQYHPDVNPGGTEIAQDKFIQLTEAYKFLAATIPSSDSVRTSAPSRPVEAVSTVATSPPVEPGASSRHTPTPPPTPSPEMRSPQESSSTKSISAMDQQLKQTAYKQLHQLLKSQRFPRAIALVEGLAQRIPDDIEVRQWQAITYQRWGRHLVRERKLEKARIYLQKALRTDPYNRSLYSEVEQDFRQMAEVLQISES